MTRRKQSKGEEYERDHQDERESAGNAVRIFDCRGDLRGARENLTIAKRPVLAAPCARSGGAYKGAPKDHRDVESENKPRVRGKTGLHDGKAARSWSANWPIRSSVMSAGGNRA